MFCFQTSNHPEKLDEALIRPGRIDKKILLDYLQCPQAIQASTAKNISHFRVVIQAQDGRPFEPRGAAGRH